jgi:cellulose synthase (UDP-forming)
MGTMGIGLQLMRSLVRRPRMLTPAQWWEYFLSGSYYFIGLANLVFMLAPLAFFAFGVHPLRLGARVYLLLMVPQVGFNLGLFLVAMRLRGVPPAAAWLATALAFSTFWTYTRAAVTALLGLRRPFGVTPKGVGGVLPLRSLVPELLALTVSVGCALASLLSLAVAGPDLAYLVNGFWAAYNAVQLSTLFVHFNRPVTIAERARAFRPVSAGA